MQGNEQIRWLIGPKVRRQKFHVMLACPVESRGEREILLGRQLGEDEEGGQESKQACVHGMRVCRPCAVESLGSLSSSDHGKGDAKLLGCA